MSARVLVPIDGSDPGFEALAYSFQLFPDTPHETLYVIDPGEDTHAPPSSDDWKRRARRRAQRVNRQAQELANRMGRSLETETAVGRPQQQIVQYANREEVRHISLGGTGQTRSPEFQLGSVAHAVADRATCSVTVVPADQSRPDSARPDRVLVGIDGNKTAVRGLEFALETVPTADITAIAVSNRLSRSAVEDVQGTYLEELLDDARAVANEHLEQARTLAENLGMNIQTQVVFGTPSRRLIETAVGDGYDHIVLGAGNRPRGRAPLGRVADAVLRHAPVPVTVVR